MLVILRWARRARARGMANALERRPEASLPFADKLGVVGKLAPLDVGELKIDGRLGFTGGLAKNPGITRRIERELKAEAAVSEYDPMLAGAIGAALLGR